MSLLEGLLTTPKYLPVWYRYDKQGSLYNDKCLTDNSYYYFYKSEINVISECVQVGYISRQFCSVFTSSGSYKCCIYFDVLYSQNLLKIPGEVQNKQLSVSVALILDIYNPVRVGHVLELHVFMSVTEVT